MLTRSNSLVLELANDGVIARCLNAVHCVWITEDARVSLHCVGDSPKPEAEIVHKEKKKKTNPWGRKKPARKRKWKTLWRVGIGIQEYMFQNQFSLYIYIYMWTHPTSCRFLDWHISKHAHWNDSCPSPKVGYRFLIVTGTRHFITRTLIQKQVLLKVTVMGNGQQHATTFQ